jgi:hypothetical protein
MGGCQGHTEIEDRREDNTPESRTNAQFSYQVLASQLLSRAAPGIAMVEILEHVRGKAEIRIRQLLTHIATGTVIWTSRT